MTSRAKTLVLCSGGPDSAVLLARLRERGPVAVLEVDYPGRPRGERRALGYLLRHYRVAETYRAVLAARNGAGLVRGPAARGYIPGRNLVFHANALVAARLAGALRIAAGHLRDDAGTFVDAGMGFFRGLERLANRYRSRLEPRVRWILPFQRFSKSNVWRLGTALGVPLEQTWSCYRDQARPCRRCDGCRERAAAERASNGGRVAPSFRKPRRARRQVPAAPAARLEPGSRDSSRVAGGSGRRA